MIERHKFVVTTSFLTLFIPGLALLVRLFPLSFLHYSHQAILAEYDPYYHLRRADLFLNTWSLQARDYFTAFPWGGQVNWPALQDQMLACFMAPFSRFDISAEVIAGLFPVMAGVVSIVVMGFFFIGRQEVSIRIWAMALVALLPAHLRISAFGYADHHVLEMLFTTVTLVLLMRSDRLVFACLGGFFLGLSQLTWRGGLLLVLLVVLVQIVLVFAPQSLHTRIARTKSSVVIFSCALLVFLSGDPLGYVHLERMTFWELSFFQVYPLLFFTLFFLAITLFLQARKRQAYLVFSMLLAVSVVVVFLFLDNIIEGFVFLMGKHPWRDTISESLPLFSAPSNATWWSFASMIFSGLIYCFPFMLGWFIFTVYQSSKKGEAIRARDIILIVWLIIFGLMTMRQQRYAHQLVIPFCIIVCFSWRALWGWVIKRNRVGNVILIFVMLLLMYPVFFFHWFLFHTGYTSMVRIPESYYRSLTWLREFTPTPGDFYSPGEKPDYGIMNPWDWGHWITWIARRPAVANNFGSEPGGHGDGLSVSCRFYLTENNREALDLLDRHQLKYVITLDMVDTLPVFRYILSLPQLEDSQWFFDPVSVRLHFFNGSDIWVRQGADRKHIQGVTGLRLIYQSRERLKGSFGIKVARVKIFERVQGARVVVPDFSRPPYLLSVSLYDGNGGTFLYQKQFTTAEEITLPYAARGCSYSVRAAGPASLTWQGGQMTFQATEEAVLSGRQAIVLQESR